MAKYKSRATRLSEAVDMIQGGLEEVREICGELERWRDGLTGTNLESSDLYQNLEGAVDTIDDAINNIESSVGDLESVEMPVPFRS